MRSRQVTQTKSKSKTCYLNELRYLLVCYTLNGGCGKERVGERSEGKFVCAGRTPPESIYLRFFFFFFARSTKHSQSHSNHFPSTGGATQDKMSAILLLNSAMPASSANRRTLSRLAVQTEQSRQDGELENMAELDSVRNGTLEMQQPLSLLSRYRVRLRCTAAPDDAGVHYRRSRERCK